MDLAQSSSPSLPVYLARREPEELQLVLELEQALHEQVRTGPPAVARGQRWCV